MIKNFCSCCAIFVVLLAVCVMKIPPYRDRTRLDSKGFFPLHHREEPWRFQHSEIPELTGKTIIVTGANVGLGYWTAYHLAQNNAKVIMACRNMEKAEKAKANLLDDIPNANVEIGTLDLGDLQSVKKFAADFLEKNERLDSLILNAGLVKTPYWLSEQGLEMQFAVNHLGHFYLTKLLLDLIEATNDSTVVTVSSSFHYKATDIFDSIERLNNEKEYKGLPYYDHSKLCNILFSHELHKRLRAKGVNDVYVNAIHPGAVLTEATRNYFFMKYTWFMKFVRFITDAGLLAWKPEDAALTQIYAAVAPEVIEQKISGKYFHPIARETPTSEVARDHSKQKRLWEWSEELIAKFESGKSLVD